MCPNNLDTCPKDLDLCPEDLDIGPADQNLGRPDMILGRPDLNFGRPDMSFGLARPEFWTAGHRIMSTTFLICKHVERDVNMLKEKYYISFNMFTSLSTCLHLFQHVYKLKMLST